MNGISIGILTFHRCINYGSYWQAYCLAQGLKQRGYEAVLLDHYSPRINRTEWRCALQPVLPTAGPQTDRSLYRQKVERFFAAFRLLPLSPGFPLDDPSQMEAYDIVVVGSDEVWNLTHPWYGNCPLFYGEGIKAGRLISYGASFGNYPASGGLDPFWQRKLLQFHRISVRDENSQHLIQATLGFAPQIVLDPCLQFPIDSSPLNPPPRPPPYLALYGHNFSPTFIRALKQSARRKKLPLISVGYRNEGADEQWIAADPQEFVTWIAHAEAVATNFFHGCVFALNHAKPFICEASTYRSNKVWGLMKQIGGEKHLMTEETTEAVYHARLSEPLETEIFNQIDALRRSSESYLQLALGPKRRNEIPV